MSNEVDPILTGFFSSKLGFLFIVMHLYNAVYNLISWVIIIILVSRTLVNNN